MVQVVDFYETKLGELKEAMKSLDLGGPHIAYKTDVPPAQRLAHIDERLKALQASSSAWLRS